MGFFKKFLNGAKENPIKISDDRVEEIIDKIVEIVSKYGLELPAFLIARPFVPTSTLISQTIIVPFSPFIEMLGINGFEIAAFLDNKENLKKLTSKLEESKINKENAKKKQQT